MYDDPSFSSVLAGPYAAEREREERERERERESSFRYTYISVQIFDASNENVMYLIHVDNHSFSSYMLPGKKTYRIS